jgi:hypothetical protein
MGLRGTAPIGLSLCIACGSAFSTTSDERTGSSDAGRPDAASLHSPGDATHGATPDDASVRADAVANDSPAGVTDVDAETTLSDADQTSDAPGYSEASADAASGCHNGCGPHEVCAYRIADACGAIGMCVTIPPPSNCNAIVLEMACGCDGHAVHWNGGCKPALPDGYAPATVTHMGACP